MLIALDIAILLPPHIATIASRLNGSLPSSGTPRLVLDRHHLPHITLTQQFVKVTDLDPIFAVVDGLIDQHRTLRVRVSGAERVGSSVSLRIEHEPAIAALHEQLMNGLEPFERTDGDVRAFVDADTQERAIEWVREYRRRAAYENFQPHITIGHGIEAPDVAPCEFDATTVAACHLGHFCSCRVRLREWQLGRRADPSISFESPPVP